MCLSAFARSNKLYIYVTVNELVDVQRSAIVRCADFLFWLLILCYDSYISWIQRPFRPASICDDDVTFQFAFCWVSFNGPSVSYYVAVCLFLPVAVARFCEVCSGRLNHIKPNCIPTLVS